MAVDFELGDAWHYTLSPKVYVKRSWGDAWAAAPGLHCEESIFTTAPGIGSARFFWQYGVGVLDPKAKPVYESISPKSLSRWLVKVDWLRAPSLPEVAAAGGVDAVADPIAATWLGIFEVDQRQIDGTIEYNNAAGVKTVDTTGVQHLYALGIEKLLEQTILDASYFLEAGRIKKVDRGITFNDRGRKNRSQVKTAHGVPVFAQAGEDKFHWRSVDIVKYLLREWNVRNGADRDLIPFTFDNFELSRLLFHWDEPIVEQHNQRLWNLLSRLVNSRRTQGFYLELDVGAFGGLDALKFVPFTYTDVPIRLPLTKNIDDDGNERGPASINSNRNTVILKVDFDESAELGLKSSTVDTYDAVHVRGARIRVCGTWSFDDVTMKESWKAAGATTYNNGATAWPSYAASGLTKKRSLNDEARAQPELDEVFARFEIALPWDGRLGKGVEGTPGDLAPAMPFEDEAESFPLYQCDLAILNTIPLVPGVDYSGSRIKDNPDEIKDDEEAAADRGERPPLISWKIPATSPARWIDITKIGEGNLRPTAREQYFKWAAAVVVEHGENGIWLRISGAPKHVIAFADFIRIAGVDRYLGENNFRSAGFTLAVNADKYCEGIAKIAGLGARLDEVRRLILYAGDEYKKDYVAACTIVGFTDDGALKRSDGGWVRDDSPLLQGAADAALGWYSKTRATVSFATGQIKKGLGLGSFIQRIEYRDPLLPAEQVNTVVTELRFTCPQAFDTDDPGVSKMGVQTNEGQFDVLQRRGTR